MLDFNRDLFVIQKYTELQIFYTIHSLQKLLRKQFKCFKSIEKEYMYSSQEYCMYEYSKNYMEYSEGCWRYGLSDIYLNFTNQIKDKYFKFVSIIWN